jgi:hypothetical protein
MILLFTTVDAKSPFHKRDLLNVCCEAKGAPITFGYHHKWIASTIQPDSLWGQEALIIFNEVLSVTNEFRFHPLRLARIARAADDYDAVALELDLGEFANYKRDEAEVEKFLAAFTAYVKLGDHPRPKTTGETSVYVRQQSDAFDPSAFNGEWLPLVEHMRKREGLSDSTFMAARPTDKTTVLPSTLMDKCVYRNGRSTYKIVGGQSRELAFRMIVGSKANAVLPELIIKDSVASVSGPFLRQQSSGFEARFVLTFGRSFQEQSAMLSVRMPLVKTNEAMSYVSPEHQAHVELKISHFTLWTAIVLLVVGAFLQSLTPDQLTNVPMKPNWVFVKVVASLMIGVGAFLGFRKLPIKT